MASKADAPLWILVDDLERYASSSVAPHLDGKVVTDALGRRWISNPDAAVALKKAEEDWQREINLRAEYENVQRDRAERRTALIRQISQKVRADNPWAGDSQLHHIAVERQRIALEEFDRKNPELGYYEWRDR